MGLLGSFLSFFETSHFYVTGCPGLVGIWFADAETFLTLDCNAFLTCQSTLEFIDFLCGTCWESCFFNQLDNALPSCLEIIGTLRMDLIPPILPLPSYYLVLWCPTTIAFQNNMSPPWVWWWCSCHATCIFLDSKVVKRLTVKWLLLANVGLLYIW